MVFDQLQQASFKGFTFLLPAETISGGKKTVDHEYPGSNDRFVEELGRKSKDFSIKAIIHGSNVLNDRKRFQDLLDEPGVGLLIHPYLGSLSVKAVDYTSSTSDDKIGLVEFNITFKESVEVISITDTGATPKKISDRIKDAFGFIDDAFITAYENTSFLDSSLSSIDAVSGVLDTLEDVTSQIKDPDLEQVNDFTKKINSTRRKISTTVTKGTNLVTDLRDIYNKFFGSAKSPDKIDQNQFSQVQSYGEGRIKKDLITARRIEIENNLEAIEEYNRLNALAGEYESVVYTDFSTSDEIISKATKLEEKYQELVINSTGKIATDPDTRRTFEEIRVLTKFTLDKKIKNAWRVVEVDKSASSLSVISYTFYGNIDNIEDLKTLNEDSNHAIILNPIKALN